VGLSWKEHLSELRDIDFASYEGLKYDVQYKLVNAVDYGVPQCRERVFIVGLRNDLGLKWSWPEKVDGRKTIADAIGNLPDAQVENGLGDHVFIDGAREYPGHTGSDYNRPSKTIKAGAHGVPGGENMIRFPDGTLRYMTIHEAKLIQTFPDDYCICGSWGEALRQIGNAVPVHLAKVMGDQMRLTLAAAGHKKLSYKTDASGNLLLFEKRVKERRKANGGVSKARLNGKKVKYPRHG